MTNRNGWGQSLLRCALLVMVALQGCGALGASRHDDNQRELNRNRRQWQAQAVENYRFVARRGCYCPGEVVAPVVVEVRNGEITSLAYQETGTGVGATLSGLWPPLEGVFDIVQDAIDREAADLTVEYDPDFGFPRAIAIDYMENVIDEELAFTVEGFEVLP